MALPLPRFVNAFLEWKRRRLVVSEEGQQRWQQLVAEVARPPVAARAAAAGPEGPAATPRMSPDQQAAAFAAFASMNPSKEL